MNKLNSTFYIKRIARSKDIFEAALAFTQLCAFTHASIINQVREYNKVLLAPH